MDNVVKLRPSRYSADSLIDDLVEDRENIAHIMAITIDKDGNIFISGSRMTNAQVCMCAVIAQAQAYEAVVEGRTVPRE